MAVLLLGLAALGYWAASIGFQYNLFHRRQPLKHRWPQLVYLSHAVHTAGLIALTIKLQHLPVSTMHEVIAIVGWVLVALYAFLGRRWKVQALGSIAAPAAAMLTTFAAFTLGHENPVPKGGLWFWIHVGSLVGSYAAFALASCCAGLYFVQSRRLKQKKLTTAFLLPSLDTLDRVGFRFIMVGFPLLILGISSGMLIKGWTWSWDPKETLVGVTCGVYLSYLHARMVSGWQGRRVNLLLLIAALCVLISFLAPGRFH